MEWWRRLERRSQLAFVTGVLDATNDRCRGRQSAWQVEFWVANVQIEHLQPHFQSLPILLLRHPVHSRRSRPHHRVAAVPEQAGRHMMQQRGELLLLILAGCFPHTSESLGHAFPTLCPARESLVGVSLGRTASLRGLRQGLLLCVQTLRRYSPVRPTPRWRACWSYSSSPSPAGPACCCGMPTGSPGSRAWNFQACLGSLTAQDSRVARVFRHS